jgi:HEAT repeat protein
VRSGEQSIERLAVAQRDLKVDLHIYILNTLEDVIKRGEIHLTPAAIEALLAGLDRSVFPIKVVTAVGGPAVEPLLHLLGQKRGNNSWVTQIIEALGLIGDRRAVEHLLPYLAHTNSSWVREKTVVALGLLGDARATVPLVSTIKDAGYDRALWETPNALVRLGAPAVETLLSLLMTEDPRTKSTLIEVLGKIGDPQAIQPLVEIMRGEEEVLRFNAATALAAFGELAIAPLAAMLEERDTSLVGLAIRTLGGTKRPEALAPLVALLQRKRENLPVDVFWTAIETIAKAQRLEER